MKLFSVNQNAPFRSQIFKKKFRLRRQGGIDPPNQNPADVPEWVDSPCTDSAVVCVCVVYSCSWRSCAARQARCRVRLDHSTTTLVVSPVVYLDTSRPPTNSSPRHVTPWRHSDRKRKRSTADSSRHCEYSIGIGSALLTSLHSRSSESIKIV